MIQKKNRDPKESRNGRIEKGIEVKQEVIRSSEYGPMRLKNLIPVSHIMTVRTQSNQSCNYFNKPFYA